MVYRYIHSIVYYNNIMMSLNAQIKEIKDEAVKKAIQHSKYLNEKVNQNIHKPFTTWEMLEVLHETCEGSEDYCNNTYR